MSKFLKAINFRSEKGTRMKGYMILGEPIIETEMPYRGTYRVCPTYVESFDSESKLNALFRWYISEGGEAGVVQDLKKSIQYVHEHQVLSEIKTFEVLSVSNEPDVPPEGELLGYDLSCGYHYSLLSWSLNFQDASPEQTDAGVLLQLAGDYFRPRLNSYGLFGNRSDAKYCLDCLAALHRVCPNLLEGGDEFEFEVVGLGIPQIERK